MVAVGLIFLGSVVILASALLIFRAFDWIKHKIAARAREKALSQSSSGKTGHLDQEPLFVPTREDLELFQREPFASNIQECLVIVLSTETKTVGVCAYLNDLEVDYFVEDFPPCCQRHPNEHALRSFLGTMSALSEKWVYAEAITFLHNDFYLIKSINTEGTQNARHVGKFEAKYYYRVIPQWTENYICDRMELEDFWEDMVDFTKRLLNTKDLSKEKLWKRFPLNHWKRRRIAFKIDDFHQVPHPGNVEKLHKKMPNLMPQVQEQTTAVLVPID